MRRFIRVSLLGVAVAVASLSIATPALAQAGRVGGRVLDEATGEPIKGAQVIAENPQASPSTFKATTDDDGRYSILGMKNGMWTFTATAPGYAPSQGQLQVQTLRPNPPVEFKLAKGASGPLGALAGVDTKEIQAELQSADLLMSSGQYDAAIAGYKAILEKAPALSVINLQIANAYRAKKEYDNAIGAYQAVLKDDPANEKALIGIGMTNLEKGDMEAADTTLTAAAQSPGASREVFYNLGEVKFAKGATDEAAQWYQKAADADPTWGKPLFKLALVALNKKDMETTAQYLQKVIEVDPTSVEATQAQQVLTQIKPQ